MKAKLKDNFDWGRISLSKTDGDSPIGRTAICGVPVKVDPAIPAGIAIFVAPNGQTHIIRLYEAEGSSLADATGRTRRG